MVGHPFGVAGRLMAVGSSIETVGGTVLTAQRRAGLPADGGPTILQGRPTARSAAFCAGVAKLADARDLKSRDP